MTPAHQGLTEDKFEALLAAARSGEPAGFSGLWRHYQPLMMRYLRVMRGPDAEDVASDTWLAVARGISAFEGGEADFRAWLFTIARRRAIDAGRKAWRRSEILTENAFAQRQSGELGPEDVVMGRMGVQDALALVSQLPPSQAEVVILRTVAGMDVAQVAEAVGKEPGAVRVLAHRGLARLGELIGAQGIRTEV